MSDNAKLVIPDLVAEGLRAIPAEVRAKLSLANIDALTRPLRTALDRERAERRAAALHEAADFVDTLADKATRSQAEIAATIALSEVAQRLRALAGQPDPLEAARDVVRSWPPMRGDLQSMWIGVRRKDLGTIRRALGMEVDDE